MDEKEIVLSAISGATLMELDFVPQEFVVRGLLPQGLSILGGAPKIGKSWLMLELALRVAKGEPMWGMETKQGTVLYLCLEDTYQRIQQRLYCLTDNVPGNLLFSCTASTLETDLEAELLQYLRKYPDIVLIIIDTLQMVRGSKTDPNYGNDYDDMQKFKRITDSQKVSILLVHHLRKMGDRDPLNRLSGSTGLSGSADCNYILDKSARLEDVATLTCTGRDIQDRELELRFDKTNCVWNVISDSAEDETKKLPPEMIAFIDFVKATVHYEGSNTRLAELFASHSGHTMSAKVLKQKMNRWRLPLSDLGVTFSSREVHSGKIVTVQYTPPVSHASQVSQKIAS